MTTFLTGFAGHYRSVKSARIGRRRCARNVCSWPRVLERKPLKSGLILKVPSGETPLNCVYEVEWRCVCLPAYIDVFLREFSPRHKQRLAGT